MNVQELRIGNLYNQFSNTESVSWVTLKELGNAPKSQLWCKPIPLTEEWLLKFGFEKSDYYNNFKIKAFDYWHSIKYFDGEWNYNNDNSDAGCYYVHTIKYVHQLQNLYFALTNEELTIK